MEWKWADGFPKLAGMYINTNNLTGSIPQQWAASGAFPALKELDLSYNNELCGAVPAHLDDAVCGTGQDGTSINKGFACEDGVIPCPNGGHAARPPSPPTSPAASTEAQPSTSSQPTPPPPPDPNPSSAPIGAIVGGVVGGLVVAAVLAFLAFRPNKGWLRKTPAAVSPALSLSKSSLERLTPAGDNGGKGGTAGSQAGQVAPPLLPPGETPKVAAAGLPAGWAAAEGPGVDTFIDAKHSNQPGSALVSVCMLPQSYLSSMGGWRPPAATVSGPSPSSQSHSSGGVPGSLRPLDSDPLLGLISSYLASRPLDPSTQHSGEAAASAASAALVASSAGSMALRADVRDWEVPWSDLQLQALAGHGSFGNVYLARLNETPVAVKVLICRDDFSQSHLQLPADTMKELQQEAAVMVRMRHPNICTFMGLTVTPPALITEYCARGSLYDQLRSASRQPEAAAQLTWHRRLGMALDAAMGLCYLHSRKPPIIHRDVKSPNLLVTGGWSVKVADFNLSKILEAHHPGSSLSTGGPSNPTWLAPEVLEGGRHGTESDVYSFGIVLYELLTWRLPWADLSVQGLNAFKVAQAVVAGQRPQVPPREALPGPGADAFAGLDAYVALMRDCWAADASARPTFSEVVPRLRAMVEEEQSTS